MDLHVEAHLHVLPVGICGLLRRLLGGLLLHLRAGVLDGLLHLIEGHYCVGLFLDVDLGDGLLVEIDDLNVVGRDVGEAIVFEVDGGDDGIADVTGLRTEDADRLHHVQERAAGELGGLLIGVVACVERKRQSEGKRKQSVLRAKRHRAVSEWDLVRQREGQRAEAASRPQSTQ